MMYSKQEKALIALSLVDGIGSKRMTKLLAMVNEPHQVFELDRAFVKKAIGERAFSGFEKIAGSSVTDDHIANAQRLGMRIVCRFSDSYPEQLENIVDPPYVLYMKGNLKKIPQTPMLGSVGTRTPTRYGQEAAYSICRELARAGVMIISGMARGIDTCSHKGCLDGGGQTIAVLGSGVDICYPPENISIYERIMENGLIVSEYKPGQSPMSHHFRVRNRIIAGLSEAVMVTEGAKGSGSGITAEYAMNNGRELFAIPGQINSPLSYMPNLFIKEGAHMVLGAEDILSTMKWKDGRIIRPETRAIPVDLSEEEAKIVAPLLNEELSFEELIEKTGFAADMLNSLLTMLQLRGIIKQHSGRVYSIN